ncbi:hypothetical protein OPQ81_000388 [Rhizoctonia solani]|nr:hypothetical protein OPQ81_000388 [Rhizoctonia solani]
MSVPGPGTPLSGLYPLSRFRPRSFLSGRLPLANEASCPRNKDNNPCRYPNARPLGNVAKTSHVIHALRLVRHCQPKPHVINQIVLLQLHESTRLREVNPIFA